MYKEVGVGNKKLRRRFKDKIDSIIHNKIIEFGDVLKYIYRYIYIELIECYYIRYMCSEFEWFI